MSTNVWTIVLAAGAGRRLASLTGGMPKQFWRPRGAAHTLLDATLLRLSRLNTPERTVAIVDAAHRSFLQPIRTPLPFDRVIYQPMDRGTAAGVLLPLLFVLHRAPDSIVIVTPADHAFDDEEAFEQGISRAVSRIRSRLSDVVLFGAEPHTGSADYGWITATPRENASEFQLVAEFVEKPGVLEAAKLFGAGSVWNTMVLVASGKALLRHFHEHLPFLTEVLITAIAIEEPARERFLTEWYPKLPRADFSRDLLTLSRPLSLYTWSADAGWSDLGTPERLEEWLAFRSGAAGDALVRRIKRLQAAPM